MISLNGNFNSVELLRQDGSVYKIYKILHTNTIDNEVISMMGGRYKRPNDRDPLTISKDISSNLTDEWKFTQSELSVIYTVSASQFDEEEPQDPFCFSTTIGSSKIYVLDVIQPTDIGGSRISHVLFRDDVNDIEYKIDLYNNNPYAYSANYLILLFQGLDQLKNFSPHVHEYMQYPHSNTLDITFLQSKLSKVYDLPLLDGLFNNQSQTRLGDTELEFDDEYVGNSGINAIKSSQDNSYLVNIGGLTYGKKYS